jgi:hypothetical protein
MVEIYLNTQPFLSIPNGDVRRLSVHPFSWLRYVMFSICGAHGDLSATPNGPPVDYHSTELAEVPYYYTPSGKVYCLISLLTMVPIHSPDGCIFVDHQALNDRITSTSVPCHHPNFRDEVVARDGSCIITRRVATYCDAAHLIPHSKGDEVMFMIILCEPLMMVCSSTLRG